MGFVGILFTATVTLSQDSKSDVKRSVEKPSEEKPSKVKSQTDVTKPNQVIPVNTQKTVFVDLESKKVLVKSQVVLREGLLEMLVCLKQSKEHESILSVDSKAEVIHAALLSVGAEAGAPAQFIPDYKPASGQEIDIYFQWTDEEGKLHRDSARSWVRQATRRFFVEKLDPIPKDFAIPKETELRWDSRHKELLWFGTMSESQRDQLLKLNKDSKYQKAIRSLFDMTRIKELDSPWVFAGSGFVEDPDTGKKHYLAEGGDLICVANFTTATLDLAINSSSTNDVLMFEAYTERIPPIGTEVTMELIPVEKKQPEEGKKEQKSDRNE